MIKTSHILSIFTIMVALLNKRAAKLQKEQEALSEQMNVLIHKREAAVAEKFRAQAAIKKLREFGV